MTETLSLEIFHERYAGEKPYFEYWNGEPVQKSFPDLLHSRVQWALVSLLGALGYDSGFEITIKLDPAYELVPDVIAAEGRIADPYPTEPFEVAMEILSSHDPFSRVLRKCQLYKTLGIRQVGLVDPDDRTAWSFEDGLLQRMDVIARRGELVITAQQLWAEVDQLYPRPAC